MNERQTKNTVVKPISLLGYAMPGLFFAFTLFIFAPTEFFLTHSGDFWFGYDQVFPALIGAAAIFVVISTILLKILPQRASVFIGTLLIVFTFLIYNRATLWSLITEAWMGHKLIGALMLGRWLLTA